MTHRHLVAAAALLLLATGCSAHHTDNATPPTAGSIDRGQTPPLTASLPISKTPLTTGSNEPTQPAGYTNAASAAGLVPAGSVPAGDPSAVAVAVVTTINRHDTQLDSSPVDAVRRAGRWLTPALLADSLAVPERGDAAWTNLAHHRGYTTVDHIDLANETGQPPDTATTATVQITYQIQQIGRDGWRGTPTGQQLQRIALTRTTSTKWHVSGFSDDE